MNHHISKESIRELSLLYFYKGRQVIRQKDDDVRKFKIKEFEQVIRRVRIQTEFVAYGNLLSRFKDILDDKNSSESQKLSEIQGELEILVKESLDNANNISDCKLIDSSIDRIKKSFKLE